MAAKQRQRAKLSALLRWNLAATLASAAAAVAVERSRTQSVALLCLARKRETRAMRSGFQAILIHGAVAIATETARKQRQEQQIRAYRLLAGMMGRRQYGVLVKTTAKWRWGTAALSMEVESRLRCLFHGTIAIAAETARQQRARNQALACRLLAGVVNGRGTRELAKAMSKLRMGAVEGTMVLSRRSAVVISLLRKKQERTLGAALNKLAFQVAVSFAADTAREQRQKNQTRSCRLLAGIASRRHKRGLAYVMAT